MFVETRQEAARAQEQIEDFARLAHDVKLIVSRLESAFHKLQDCPEALSETLWRLTGAAGDVAAIAAGWAQEGDAGFDPATLRSN
jgi:hypothetical protein